MPDGNWLACELTKLDGSETLRFGPDEADPGDVPLDLGFSSQIPGGFGDASVTLRRPRWISAEQMPLFNAARFYGPGNRTVYEGRVKTGGAKIDADSIRLDLEGWSAHLDDDETWRFLGVHNDLTAWQGPSVQRQLNVLAASADMQQNGGAEPDTTGLSALATRLTGETNRACRCEMSLGLGVAIAEVRGAWKKNSAINAGDGNWAWHCYLSTDDVFTSFTGTSNLRAAGPGTFTLSGSGKVAVVALIYGAALAFGGALEGWNFDVFWTALSAFGSHGLTPQAMADGRYGLLGSDAIRYGVQQAAPLLSVGSDAIEPSGLVIPHLVVTDSDRPLRELIERSTALGGATGKLNDWGVYEDRGFFWRSPGSYGRSWRVRRDQVATPTDDGLSTEARFSSVMVFYTDGAGQTRSVGPVGSGADYETSLLTDPDPDNPAHRLPNRRKRASVGVTSQEGAVNIGVALLAEQYALTRRQTVSIQGYATDSAGNEHPAAMVRAGDRLLIEDDDGHIAEEPVNSTSFDQGSLTATANLGAAPHSVEVMLSQLEAVTP